MTQLKPVTAAQPCAICGGNHKCSRGEDGLLLCCRPPGDVPGFRYLGRCQGDSQFGLYRRDDDRGRDPPPAPDWEAVLRRASAALTPTAADELATALGLPQWVLHLLPVGYRPGREEERGWIFPERDGRGWLIGLQRRAPDGGKRTLAGGHRGLTVASGWRERVGPVFLPEGASDTLTLLALNLCAVGRPSNTGGVEQLAELLRDWPADRPIVVLGEFDPKPTGQWPGRDGAVQTAAALAGRLGRPVAWTLPPDGAKDVRAWLADRHPDPTCLDMWHDLGDQLLAQLTAAAQTVAAAAGPPAGGWEAPVPLPEAPAACAFPVDVLPPRLAAFVDEAAAALDCPADYLGAPMLAVAGAAIGASRALRIKDSWAERPAVYLAMLGPPGSTKSPALKVVAEPVYEAQNRLLAEFEVRLEQHEARLAAWEPPKRPALPWEDVRLGRAAKPVRPVLSRLYAADTTTEALAPLLRENPRGLVLLRDELAAWVTAMNQYKAGRGSDRQFYLAAWAGEPICVDRKTPERLPVLVAHPFLAVAGGLTTDMLGVLREARGRADGFLDRILFAFPDPAPSGPWNRHAIAPESLAAWREVLQALWALQPEPAGGGSRPRFVRLDRDGEAAWEAFYNAHAAEINAADFPDHLRGPWVKLKAYAARLALIVHCLRQAAGEVAGEDVDAASVERAVRLVDYFKAHARKAYASMDADPAMAQAAYLLGWIHRYVAPGGSFSRVQAYQANKRRWRRPDALDEPLRLLTDLRHIRPVVLPPREGGGRPASPRYETNPES